MPGTAGAIPDKAISSNLNALVKTRTSPQKQIQKSSRSHEGGSTTQSSSVDLHTPRNNFHRHSPLVPWSFSLVVLWSRGLPRSMFRVQSPLVLWSFGLLVSGPVTRWSRDPVCSDAQIQQKLQLITPNYAKLQFSPPARSEIAPQNSVVRWSCGFVVSWSRSPVVS